MNEIKISKYLPQLIGKTIQRVCYREATNSSAPTQVIFEFTDGSNYEIYGLGGDLSFTGEQNFHGKEKYLDCAFNASRSDEKYSALAENGNVIFSEKK